MAQSLFSFNSYIIALSSPPPLSSSIISLSAMAQGTTNFILNFNELVFSTKPYKILVNWPSRQPIVINEIYDISNKLYTSQFLPISSFTQNVLTAKYYYPTTYDPTVVIYYENGIIHTFALKLTINPENAIDLDLDVLSIQNTDQDYGTIYNLQSNSKNIVFNSTDIEITTNTDLKVDGYV